MPNSFSGPTLKKFEDASASIPLRQLDRVFQVAAIGLGEDPGVPDGARRVQFRRYVASIDQHDPQQLDRLGKALGALLAEVAASKQQFLMDAAERDGFSFAGGVFRLAEIGPHPFAVERVGDVAAIDEHARRLHLLAIERPRDAIAAAKELVESMCRSVLRESGAASEERIDPAVLAIATLAVSAIAPRSSGDTDKAAALLRQSLRQLCAVVSDLDELLHVDALNVARDEITTGISPRHARLAVGAAVTFARFIAETYDERTH